MTPGANVPSSRSQVLDLGHISYQDAWQRQVELREQRIAGRIPDTLLLLEHPPTITIGRGGKAQGVLMPREFLASRGIEVHDTERGGQVTYHGPGQVVGYLIVDIQQRGMDVHQFVQAIEEVLIDTLADVSIQARCIRDLIGVWVEDRKIAAIGLHLRKWVSIHGFALNVNPDLSHFDYIVPCGITDAAVTSIAKELGDAFDPSKATLPHVKSLLTRHFLQRFP